MDTKTNKNISLSTINHIKALDALIFGYEDDDYVNNRGVANCYRAMKHTLSKIGILDAPTQDEVLHTATWSNSHAAEDLRKLGWSILDDTDHETDYWKYGM